MTLNGPIKVTELLAVCVLETVTVHARHIVTINHVLDVRMRIRMYV